MSKFKIRQIGREGLYNYHKNNKQSLSEDQEINSRFPTELNKLKVGVVNSNDELFHSMNSVLNNKENILIKTTQKELSEEKTLDEKILQREEDSNVITPIDDILSSITKDDVKRNRKKRVDLNSTRDTTIITDSSLPEHKSLESKEVSTTQYPHSSKYFKRAPSNTTFKNAVRVTLYNKGYEKDLF